MFEISVAVRNNKGEPTGELVTKSFNTAAAVAAWYNSQRGHSIDREFEQYHKKMAA